MFFSLIWRIFMVQHKAFIIFIGEWVDDSAGLDTWQATVLWYVQMDHGRDVVQASNSHQQLLKYDDLQLDPIPTARCLPHYQLCCEMKNITPDNVQLRICHKIVYYWLQFTAECTSLPCTGVYYITHESILTVSFDKSNDSFVLIPILNEYTIRVG